MWTKVILRLLMVNWTWLLWDQLIWWKRTWPYSIRLSDQFTDTVYHSQKSNAMLTLHSSRSEKIIMMVTLVNGTSKHFRQRNAFLKIKLIYLRISGKTCGKTILHFARNQSKIILAFICKMRTMIIQTNIWDSRLKDVSILRSITTHAILMRKLTNL